MIQRKKPLIFQHSTQKYLLNPLAANTSISVIWQGLLAGAVAPPSTGKIMKNALEFVERG